jgi:hypothetical protein
MLTEEVFHGTIKSKVDHASLLSLKLASPLTPPPAAIIGRPLAQSRKTQKEERDTAL